MSSIASPYPAAVLADVLVSPRARVARIGGDVALVTAGAALVALSATLVIPFWPVPLTMQTFAVLVVGTVLGPWRGAASLALYLLVGVAGLPVFAQGHSGSLLALTSGGFIVGFVLAAALVGWLARRAWDRRVLGTAASFLAGSVLIYAVGLPWLGFSLAGLGPQVWHDALGYDSVAAATIGTGLLPFLIGDAVKCALAAIALPAAWWGVRAVDRASGGGARRGRGERAER